MSLSCLGKNCISTIVDGLYYIYTTNEKRSSMNAVENEVMNELNWKERIVVKLFAKTFEKVYNKCRIKVVNSLLE